MASSASPEIHSLALDLVAWVAAGPRSYEDVMTAWRSSCPALTIWEDAVDLGLLVRDHHEGIGTMVTVTARGRSLLAQFARQPAAR